MARAHGGAGADGACVRIRLWHRARYGLSDGALRRTTLGSEQPLIA